MLGVLAAAVFVSCFLLLLSFSLALEANQSGEKKPFTIKGMFKAGNAKLKVLLVKKKKPSKKKDTLEQKLNAAGMLVKAEEFVVLKGFAVLMGAGLLYLISQQLLFLPIGALIGYLAPGLWLKHKQKKRVKQFNEGLPAMIASINGSLRAGFSFLQALQMTAEEAHSPIKEEVEYVLKTMQYGVSLEEALIDWKKRMPSGELDLLVEAILIQRQVGGNLAYLLDKILETTRQRTKIENQIKTLTAQGKLSGLIISLLPVGLGIVIYMMNPDYIGTLFTHPIGRLMLVVALIGGIIGFAFIRKITTIEV